MHRFFQAIGFSEFKDKRQLDALLKDIIAHPDTETFAIDSDGNEFSEITRMYSEYFGIKICGEYLDDNSFYIDYFYPIFLGRDISTDEQIDIERHMENESYAGVCDEMKLGVSLIFYLQNVAEYLNQKSISGAVCQNVTTTLSALSLSGKVILPICKNEEQIRNTEQNRRNRSHLIAAAREGDEEAIESLTLEDIDLYSMISRRVVTEDVLSIVESFFMPYSIESDHYSIMGQILDLKYLQNNLTKEVICMMKVNANDLIFDLCINKRNLFGEPKIGRRFKGNVWMQGKINFSE